MREYRKRIALLFYATIFTVSAAVSYAQAGDIITISNGCVTISMHQSIHADAVEAGLYDYMNAQCGGGV